MYMMTQW